jgi:hypothetical protein
MALKIAAAHWKLISLLMKNLATFEEWKKAMGRVST